MKKRITRSFVPNLLTLANLFSGFASLVYSAQHDFERAAMFIVAGAIFDMLDGVAARLINAASEFGVELDSLCDVVSFGIAPSFMLYYAYFFQYGEMGMLFASMPALMGVLRLARFNVELNSLDDKKYFIGLPIPSAALIIISYIIFVFSKNEYSENIKDYLTFGVTIVVSLAMISRIKYENIPRPTPKYIKENPLFFSVFILGIIGVVFSKGSFIFPMFMLYVVGGAIRHFWKWIHTIEEPDDDPELIDEEYSDEFENIED